MRCRGLASNPLIRGGSSARAHTATAVRRLAHARQDTKLPCWSRRMQHMHAKLGRARCCILSVQVCMLTCSLLRSCTRAEAGWLHVSWAGGTQLSQLLSRWWHQELVAQMHDLEMEFSRTICALRFLTVCQSFAGQTQTDHASRCVASSAPEEGLCSPPLHQDITSVQLQIRDLPERTRTRRDTCWCGLFITQARGREAVLVRLDAAAACPSPQEEIPGSWLRHQSYMVTWTLRAASSRQWGTSGHASAAQLRTAPARVPSQASGAGFTYLEQ